MARILVPLPDTDFDPTETAVPWHVLREAGHDVVFATEHGTTPTCDPLLVDLASGENVRSPRLPRSLMAREDAQRLYAAMRSTPAFRSPSRWDGMDAKNFDALLLPGGHAPGMRPYLGSALLQSAVGAFGSSGKPVAAICHGTVLAARSRDPVTGLGFLYGKRTTALPKYMEIAAYLMTFYDLGRYYRTYDAYVEDEVKSALAAPEHFARGPLTVSKRGTETDDTGAFVVQDGAYLSARWPGDAWLFARTFVQMLPASSA